MEEENPEKPVEQEAAPETPVEPTPEAPVEPTPEAPVEHMEPPAPKSIRNRRRRNDARDKIPSIVVPEIDDRFWATLLRTQREAEQATKLQRISEFNLL